MRAVYLQVQRPEKLVWTEPGVEGGMTTTITFVELDDGQTEVITHQANVPAMRVRRRSHRAAGWLICGQVSATSTSSSLPSGSITPREYVMIPSDISA